MVIAEPPVGLQARRRSASPACRTLHHAERDGEVEGDDRARIDPLEQAVEPDDLDPVGVLHRGRLVVHRRDRRPAAGTGRPDPAASTSSRSATPSSDEGRGPSSDRSCSASGTSDPSGPTRARWRASVRSIRASSPPTSASSGARARSRRVRRMASAASSRRWSSVTAGRRVALVEHEVEHPAAPPPGGSSHSCGGRRLEPGPGLGDALLGPADALGHRRLGHEEGRRDLGRGQAAHRPQGQRHLRRRGERRMAAQEQQRQLVVVVAAGVSSARRAPRPTSVGAPHARRRPPGSAARSRRGSRR